MAVFGGNLGLRRDELPFLLNRLHRVLRSDAYMFLGSAETTMGIHDGYERQPWGKTGFYRPH